MALFQNRGNDDKKQASKELQRLKRQDILELLLEQMQEGDDLRETVARLEAEVDRLNKLVAHLIERLDLKDELIDKLKGRLDIKDRIVFELMRQGKKLPASSDLLSIADLLEVEQIAFEAVVAKKDAEGPSGEGVAAPSNTEPETERKPERKSVAEALAGGGI